MANPRHRATTWATLDGGAPGPGVPPPMNLGQGQGTSEAITVGMRLRPLLSQEQGQQPCISINDNVVSIRGDVTGVAQDFAFDVAMDSTDPSSPDYCSQEQCYELMGKKMLNHMMQGFHTCLFCYGQTGTGKTTTIMGKANPPSERGLLLRLIQDVFQEVDRLRDTGLSVQVKVQMLEVYNERLNDLLSDPHLKKKNKLDVRVHPELGVYVTGATEELCESAQDCIGLIDFGNTMKTVHATAMNAQSSRGHTVFKLVLERRGGSDHQILTSEVYFADLAGRENERTTQVTGDRLQELTFINRSLMWLANCINSLGGRDASGRRMTVTGTNLAHGHGHGHGKNARKPDMAKFRNSKLTLLLSNALSGNSRTAMIGTLSPAVANFEESYSTLKFAKTVKNIKLEAKAATAVDKETLVKKLEEEVRDLKRQLTEAYQKSDTTNVLDLADRLDLTEALVGMHQKKLIDLQKESAEQGRMRSATMERLGGVRDSISTNEEPQLPYVANYSNDPYLAFKVNHHIPPDGLERCFGWGSDVDFSLPPALGVCANTGFIRNEGGRLFLRAAPSPNGVGGSRVANIEVNNVKLGLDPKELRHLDCILFGRSTTYYVFLEAVSVEAVVAKAMEQLQKGEVQQESNWEDTIKDIIGEERARDPVEESLARQYWKYQQGQHHDAEGMAGMRSWLQRARSARRMVDDANAITEIVRPHSGLLFELITMAPVLCFGYGSSNLPEFAVQLVHRVSAAKTRWRGACREVRSRNILSAVKELRQGFEQGGAAAAGGGGSCSSTAAPQTPASASAGAASPASPGFAGSSSGSTLASPRVGVGGIGSPGRSSDYAEHQVELLSVWSWQKFTARLELMHAVYREWSADKDGFILDASNDAWAEHGPVEVSEMQQEFDEQLRDTREALRQQGLELTEAKEELARLRAELALAGVSPNGASLNGASPGSPANARLSPNGLARPFGRMDFSPDASSLGQVSRCIELSKANHALIEGWVRSVQQR